MENYMIIGIVAVVVVAIACYLIDQKKKGVTCVGCPYARQCGGSCDHTKNHEI